MIADRPLSLSVPVPLLGVPIAANIDAQSSDDIKVYYGSNLDGVAVLDTDYTMSIAGDFKSFTITPLAGLLTKAGINPILIAFDPTILQTWTIPNSPRFPEGELEKALDRLTLFARRLQERLGDVMQKRGDVWEGEALRLANLANGIDGADAVTLSQMQSYITEIATGDFANEALLISYDGDAEGNSVSAALDWLADTLAALSDIVDGLSAGFLEGGTLTGTLNFKAWVDVDSAATVDLAAISGNRIRLNGIVTVSNFGSGVNQYKIILHNGIHQITAGAGIIIPGGTRAAAVGDVSVWLSDEAGVYRCIRWERASGRPITALVADISDMSANARTFNQAANFAAMRTALGLGALAVLDFDGLVYSGSSSSNVAFPIGTTVAVHTVAGDPTIARNASNAIRLDASDTGFYAVNSVGAGALLTGVWRARGFSGGGDDHFQLFQRTA